MIDDPREQQQELASDDTRAFFRYMPVNPSAESCGAYVVNAGFTAVPPKSPYPPYKHPADHDFTWQHGRVLPNYQLLYITCGEGVFDSKPSGQRPIRAGDLVILYPGVWHRYHPIFESGWDEYWLEFNGEHTHRLMQVAEFSPENPVLQIGYREKILAIFLEALELLRNEPPEYQLLLGTLAAQAIARILSSYKICLQEGRPAGEIFREVQQLLTHDPSQHNRLDQLAARLHMSYSSFRRLFKAQTGQSPRQFVLGVQLSRAADRLVRTESPICQIAEECGFESVYYFSRLFKKKTGQTPSAYRLSIKK